MDELMMLSAQIQQVDPGNPAGDLASLVNDEGSEEAAADLVRELYPGFVQRQSPRYSRRKSIRSQRLRP